MKFLDEENIAFGPVPSKVRIIVDPTIQNNIHEINVKGDFGELTVLTKKALSRDNIKAP